MIKTPGRLVPASYVTAYFKCVLKIYCKSGWKPRVIQLFTASWVSGPVNRDVLVMLSRCSTSWYIHICQWWKCKLNNLLLFFWSLSVLELLGFKYCKWIIYICTVYNFQVHEMDYQRFLLWKKYPSKIYIIIYIYNDDVSIFMMTSWSFTSELFNGFVWEIVSGYL